MASFREKFDFAKIKKEMEKREQNQRKNYSDSRFWELKVDDKTHSASAIIRFMPDQDGITFQMYFRHFFKWEENGQVRFYVRNCASTINQDCPVCTKVSQLFNSPYDSDKEKGDDRKRGPRFISNILVVKDPQEPDNDGKIFLFDYGPMVKKMIDLKINGPKNVVEDELDDEKIVKYMPCDFDEGADFLYKAIPGEGRIKHTYTASKFKTQAPLFGEIIDETERDEKIDDIMSQTYRLEDFPAKDSYPDATEVRSILGAELGIQVIEESDTQTSDDTFQEDDIPFEEPTATDADTKDATPSDTKESSGNAETVQSFIASLDED